MLASEPIMPTTTPQESSDKCRGEEEKKERAEQLKTTANRFFQEGKFLDAEKWYSEAIALDSSVPAYWSNRAFAHIKLENYGYAIRDAEEAIKLDPAFIKAYYRRASANMALNKLKLSLRDFKTVVKYVPRDPDARAKMSEVEKIIKKVEFEKALSYDELKKSVLESLNIDAIVVDDSYDGVRWEAVDSSISLEFVQGMIDMFEQQKKLHRKYVYMILRSAKQTFEALSSVVDIKIPVNESGTESGVLTVCGDVHGQFYDLLNIFRTNGFPSLHHSYLFNGDFVDRGSFSVEVILTLLAYKLLYPSNFFMSRGNHETDDMNKVYGFEGEVKAKYSDSAYKLFTEVFNAIPLAQVIENRVFVVHGGLFSRDDVSLDDLRSIDRFKQPSTDSLMCEMLWSDPSPIMGRSLSKRGVGLQFGPDVTENFLTHNNLDMLIRSHEVREEGYEIEHGGKCVTIFSAPNYCDTVGNKGAFINIRKRDNDASKRPPLTFDYQKFEAVPHPSVKPMCYASRYGGFGF